MTRENRFPEEWDEERVRRLLAHHEGQSSEEAVNEDEAAFDEDSDPLVAVPKELLPEILRLIARHRTS